MQNDVLPLGWTRRTVGGLCTLLNGLAFKPEDWSDFGLPIIRIQNLNGSKEFNRYNRPIPPAYIVEPDTLLFSWSGNQGTSFGPYRWSGPKGLLNQHIFKVTPNDGIDPDWFFYALDVVRERVERVAHGGSGLVHVRRGDLLGYDVSTPPITEQRRIAQILDTLDETIRRTDQVITKLQRMKQGLLHDLLTRGMDDNGELRDPERHPAQFKESPLGLVPQDWSVAFLARWLNGSPKNGYSPVAVDENTGIFMLGLGCLTPFGFRPKQLKNAPRNDPKVEEALLQHGDLLVSRSNTRDLVGMAGVYEDIGTPCIYPDLMMRLRPSDHTSSAFLEQVLRASYVRRQIKAEAVGTSGSMVKINASRIQNLLVAMPGKDEQKRIISRTKVADNDIDSRMRELKKLRHLKDGIRDDLLTGRVRVPQAEAALEPVM